MNDERLLLFIEGDLPAGETARLRERLEHDEVLGERLEALRGMRALLQSSASSSFSEGFGERVTRRIASERALEGASQHAAAAEERSASPVRALEAFLTDALYGPMQGLFLRVAFACLLVIAGLGAANASAYQSVTSSFVSAAFGLPTSSITEALYYAAL